MKKNNTFIPLLDLCQVLDSKRIPITAEKRKHGPYPYYGANGIQDYIDGYIFDDDLVLLAEDGGNFGSKDKPIAYRVSGKCWVNNHAHVLKPNKNVNVDYLCYALMFYNTDNLINGATRAKLTQKAMKKIKIPMLSLDLQIMVVNKIKNVENLIKKRRQQNDLLTILVKSRFVEMFGDPLSEKKYPIASLEMICTKITDGEHGSVKRISTGHPFLNAKHIKKDGTIDWNTVSYISDYDHKRIYKRCNPETGDILLTTTGTIGNIAIVPPDNKEFSMDRGITLLKLDNSKVKSEFVAILLKQPSIQEEMKINVHASAIGHLFMNQVKRLTAVVPPMDLQSEFVLFVHRIDKSRLAVQKSLDELEILKKSLLQEYFG